MKTIQVAAVIGVLMLGAVAAYIQDDPGSADSSSDSDEPIAVFNNQEGPWRLFESSYGLFLYSQDSPEVYRYRSFGRGAGGENRGRFLPVDIELIDHGFIPEPGGTEVPD